MSPKFSTMIRWTVISLVIILAATSLYYSKKGFGISRGNLTAGQTVPKESRDLIRLKLANQISIALEQASKKNREAFAASKSRIENALDESCANARRNIKNVTDKLCSFKGCATICYHIAKGDSDQYIHGIVKPQITDECLKGAEKAASELIVLEDTLATNSTEMQIQMVTSTEQVLKDSKGIDTTAFSNLVKDTSKYSQASKDQAISKSMATAGLGLSACFVRGTCATGMRLLGHIGKRLGVASGASMVAAVADGPLPIGDVVGVIIEVGGISWCAYDIYKIQGTLKNEIQPELTRNIGEFRNNMAAESEKNALALLDKYETHNKQTSANIIKSINEEK
ncbi:MAG: hypothetical protein NT118_12505 [Lentisphaerae bacterium]|nr:hypothetical protein [Lentisphaerota bacterium]